MPPPTRPHTMLLTKSTLPCFQCRQHRFWNPLNKGRTLPPPYIVFRMFRPISSPQRRIKTLPQKICQQQKIKTKGHLQLHLTVYIRNSYVCICHFNSRNRQIAHFNTALLFINTDYTQPAYFYIFSARKVLDDKGICPMFTKNNMTANKINNKNGK